MKKIFILSLFIFAIKNSFLHGEQKISLLKVINNCPSGSYIVFEHNQTNIGIILKEKQLNKIILHEVFFSKNLSKNLYDWKKRLNQDSNYFAKFETIIENDTSFTKPIFCKKNKKVSKEQIFSFSSILTSLTFKSLPKDNVKMTKDALNNPIPWKPQLIIEGKSINYSECNTYEAYWPEDGSIMSNKRIEIYLPSISNDKFLCLPIWLEIESPIGKIKIRAIDAGLLN